MHLLARYTRWLHTRWPAGHVEKLPRTNDDGSTNVPGLFVVGDLCGVPLLKIAADGGARAVQRIAQDAAFEAERRGSADGAEAAVSSRGGATGADRVHDLVIVGAGVSGMSAALEARKRGLDFRLFEASEAFSTIVNFPKGKPIFTYPKDMKTAGDLAITASVKEPLVEELRAQTIDRGLVPETARVERVRRAGRVLEAELAGGVKVRARRAIIALGRSGNFRRLGVPGEERDKVTNRLHDPMDFAGKDVLVVGGGDSAIETAIALELAGAKVTLSYRKAEFARPKPENAEMIRRLEADPNASDVAVEEPSSERVSTSMGPFVPGMGARGRVRILLSSQVVSIGEKDATLRLEDGRVESIANDAVFPMIGREAPLDFFRRSGVAIHGEWTKASLAGLVLFFAFCVVMYHWKAGGATTAWFQQRDLFPFQFGRSANPGSLAGTLAISMGAPGFWYTLAYCLCIVGFGVKRIRKKRTPYVRNQTLTLMAIQVLPLFLLPYLLLPLAGHRGAFGERHRVIAMQDAGAASGAALPAPLAAWPDPVVEESWGNRLLVKSGGEGTGAPARSAIVRRTDGRLHVTDEGRPTSWIADEFFPASEWDGHGREYWRAFGFILAWPLFLWNVFTERPMTLWLVIGVVQTFVILPLVIRVWGKGAYCGWICSCGALAETLGDDHRTKMPHGPRWNRLNMLGQAVLAVALLLLVLRVVGWTLPGDHPVNAAYAAVLQGKTAGGGALPFPMQFVNYKWFVDLFLAGIVGVGLYFHFSGRVWCRFACPLAALMHIYARFSRFAIVAEKKKCISCNVCTSVCHQGIDVMSFANKGAPMQDPECVRCSACVGSCPTGVLQFGRVDSAGRTLAVDRTPASPVRMREGV